MAYPLYAYEERYWAPVDPYLARLDRAARSPTRRATSPSARPWSSTRSADDPGGAPRVQRLTRRRARADGRGFAYYVRKFVGLFDAVARRHRTLFAGAEFEPGRRLADTPYEEQVAASARSIETEHARLLGRAGLD